MMNVLSYLKVFVSWVWRCVRAWIEIGRRLSQIEQDLQERADTLDGEIEQLKEAVSVAAEAEKSGFSQIS